MAEIQGGVQSLATKKAIQLKDGNIEIFPKTHSNLVNVPNENGTQLLLTDVLNDRLVRCDKHQFINTDGSSWNLQDILKARQYAASNIQCITYELDADIIDRNVLCVYSKNPLNDNAFTKVVINPKTKASHVSITYEDKPSDVDTVIQSITERLKLVETVFGDGYTSDDLNKISEIFDYIVNNDILSELSVTVIGTRKEFSSNDMCKQVAINTKGTYAEYLDSSTSADSDYGVQLYSRSKVKSVDFNTQEEHYTATEVYPVTNPKMVQWKEGDKTYTLNDYLSVLKGAGLTYDTLSDVILN